MHRKNYVSAEHAERILCGEGPTRLQEWRRVALSDDPERLTLLGSKTQSTSRRWTPAVEELKNSLEQTLGVSFNFALINHYDTAGTALPIL